MPVKSKIVTIEVETTMSNKDVKSIFKEFLFDMEIKIRQIQVVVVDATKK